MEPLFFIIKQQLSELAKHQVPLPSEESAPCPPNALAVSPETNIGRVKLVDCKDSHIGPKILASHVTVHLPKGGAARGRLWLLAGLLSAAALLGALALTLGLTLSAGSRPQGDGDDVIDDGGEHPGDWYYTREDRNASECEEPSQRVLRDHIVVDSLDTTCGDPLECLRLVGALEEDSDFYLAGGRVYEGWGWNCRPRKGMRVVFLTTGKTSQLDMFSFNSLTQLGTQMREILPEYEVFPACCLENESEGPSKGVLLFLQTLTNFRQRECTGENENCKQNK